MGLETKSVLSVTDDGTGAEIAAGEKVYQVDIKITHATVDPNSGNGVSEFTEDFARTYYYSEEFAKAQYPFLADEAAIETKQPEPQTAP